MSHQRGHRQPGDLEVGATDVFLEHERPHTAPRAAPPGWLLTWEARRPRWLAEVAAEAFGTFLYCWGGMGATAIMIVTFTAEEQGFGSILTVALCYGLAIALAVTFVGPTSGAHLSTGMTISFAIFKGFPWRKAPHYILAQLLGAFVGSLLVYAQFKPEFDAITAKYEAAGKSIFNASAPPGAIVLFPPHAMGLGTVFINELFASAVLGCCIYAVLDPSNVFVSPQTAPLLIGLSFFVVVACFAANGIALNTARDVGARFAMACIYGRKVFPGSYCALSALTNILGTQLGAMFQILFLSDTVRPPTSASVAAHEHQAAIEEAHLTRELTAKANGGYQDGSGIGRILSGKLAGKSGSATTSEHIEKV